LFAAKSLGKMRENNALAGTSCSGLLLSKKHRSGSCNVTIVIASALQKQEKTVQSELDVSIFMFSDARTYGHRLLGESLFSVPGFPSSRRIEGNEDSKHGSHDGRFYRMYENSGRNRKSRMSGIAGYS